MKLSDTERLPWLPDPEPIVAAMRAALAAGRTAAEIIGVLREALGQATDSRVGCLDLVYYFRLAFDIGIGEGKEIAAWHGCAGSWSDEMIDASFRASLRRVQSGQAE